MSDEDVSVEVVVPPSVPAPQKPRKPARKPARKATKKAKGNGKAAKAKTAKARKARTVDPAKLDQFGFRKGSLKSKAAAMYAGKKGATLAQVKKALDSTQFNLLGELEERGFKVTKEQISGDNDRKVTRYTVVTK
jgi:hypothetical protein